MSHLLYSSLRFLLSVVGFGVALCVANRPRFWWQELFCSGALYWLPVAILSCAWLARDIVAQRSLGRGRRLAVWVALSAVCCYGYTIAYMGLTIAPYVFFDRWPAQTNQDDAEISGIWIDEWSERDQVEELEALVGHRKPTVLAVSGDVRAQGTLSRFAEHFPYQAHTEPLEGRAISIFSQLPIGAEQISSLGVEAFPGGVFSLQLFDGRLVELGVMALHRSHSQDLFERNRITARRLSSLMRNSHQPRVVAAQFGTTPFSQFMAVYSEQARLRSLMFGAGLREILKGGAPSAFLFDSNILVSRDFRRRSFEPVTIARRERVALFFQVELTTAQVTGEPPRT